MFPNRTPVIGQQKTRTMKRGLFGAVVVWYFSRIQSYGLPTGSPSTMLNDYQK